MGPPRSTASRTAFDPRTFRRSPIMTSPLELSSAMACCGPDTNTVRSGPRGTGRSPATAAAIAAVCSCVVPQHPPMMFTPNSRT